MDARLDAAARLWRHAGHVGRVPVAGDSMAPLLHDGDIVRVKAGAEPRFGDVVVAAAAGALVIHRVVGRRAGLIVLRGDNSALPDDPIEQEAVMGRVTAVEPQVGLSSSFDAPAARALGVCIAAFAILRDALGRGPRPKAIAAAGRRLGAWLLPGVRAEEFFVLLVARQKMSGEAAERARELVKRDLDWSRVVDAARRGQLGPLLYVGTRVLDGEDAIPAQVSDQLRILYTGSWARSRQLRELLLRMLEGLEMVGVEALGHKGVALTSTVYSDAAVHVSGDIDLSVRDEDRRRAEQATHGVRQPLAERYPTRREGDSYHVELDGTAHHDLEPSLFGTGRWQCRPLDWAGIWGRAVRCEIEGRSLLVPEPTDLLLTLVANAIRRGFSPVRLVVNIAETIDRYSDEIDWVRLEAELHRTRLDRRSYIAFGFAADWFGSQVPPRLLEPPRAFQPACYERALLEWKRRRPFARLPTRVLWAGSAVGAAAVAASMALGRARPRR